MFQQILAVFPHPVKRCFFGHRKERNSIPSQHLSLNTIFAINPTVTITISIIASKPLDELHTLLGHSLYLIGQFVQLVVLIMRIHCYADRCFYYAHH
jgi:hypothetical protein